MNPFAWRLRHAREAKGLELNELARRCSVAGSVLSYWETGQRSPRDLRTLGKVIKELGVRWQWIVDGEQPMLEDGTPGPVPPKWVEGKLSLAQTIGSHPKRWSLEVIGMAEDASQADGGAPDDWKKFLDQVKEEYEKANPRGRGPSQAEKAATKMEAERERKLLELGVPPEVIATLLTGKVAPKRPRGRPRKHPSLKAAADE